MKSIKYSKGYKYQLESGFIIPTGIKIDQPLTNRWMIMLSNGNLIIHAGYAWDGPSGPTFDTKSFMRGSLVHDALYQLMGEGKLPQSAKEAADRLLQRMCIEDGMSKLRAWWVYKGVHHFGGNAAENPDEPPMTAP